MCRGKVFEVQRTQLCLHLVYWVGNWFSSHVLKALFTVLRFRVLIDLNKEDKTNLNLSSAKDYSYFEKPMLLVF
jgi:hypothetical protein